MQTALGFDQSLQTTRINVQAEHLAQLGYELGTRVRGWLATKNAKSNVRGVDRSLVGDLDQREARRRRQHTSVAIVHPTVDKVRWAALQHAHGGLEVERR